MTSCRSALLAVLALLATSGCRHSVPATEIVVRVTSDLAPAELGAVQIVLANIGEPASTPTPLWASDCYSIGADPGAVTLPLELGLVPGAHFSGPFVVYADGYRAVADCQVGTATAPAEVEQSAAVSFSPHQSLLLHLELTVACLGLASSCAVGTTCVAGSCQDNERPTLPPFSPPPDSSTSSDGGGENGGAEGDGGTFADLSAPPPPSVTDSPTRLFYYQNVGSTYGIGIVYANPSGGVFFSECGTSGCAVQNLLIDPTGRSPDIGLGPPGSGSACTDYWIVWENAQHQVVAAPVTTWSCGPVMGGKLGASTVLSSGIATAPAAAAMDFTASGFLAPTRESLFVWNQIGADGVTTVLGTRLDLTNTPVPAVSISGSSPSLSRPAVAPSIGYMSGEPNDFLVSWEDGLTLWGARVSLSPQQHDGSPAPPPVPGSAFMVAQHAFSPAAACIEKTGPPAGVRCAIGWTDRQSERIVATVFGQTPDASATVFAFPVQPGAGLPTIRTSAVGTPIINAEFGLFWQYTPTIAGVVTPRVRYGLIVDNGLGVVPTDSSNFPTPCGNGPNAPQVGPAATASPTFITAWIEPSATPGAPPMLVMCPSY
jgi:hypothetical protein